MLKLRTEYPFFQPFPHFEVGMDKDKLDKSNVLSRTQKWTMLDELNQMFLAVEHFSEVDYVRRTKSNVLSS